MAYAYLHNVVNIEDYHNRRAVYALVNALKPYGYLTYNISGESNTTFANVCNTKLYDGTDTRYVSIDTDLRTLIDDEKYVHIGLELWLDKKMTFIDTIKIKKDIVLNVKYFDEKIDEAMFEMVRELIF